MSRGPDRPPSSNSFEGRVLTLLPSLRRYARSLCRTDADGEDLLQDSLERILARRQQWAGVNLKAWTFTIMTNLYRNTAARGNRFASTDLADAEELAAPDAESDPLEKRQLDAALNGLPPEYRAVLMLVVVEGYTYQEVAVILDIPLGTVMSRLSRARARLAGQLETDNIVPLRRPE